VIAQKIAKHTELISEVLKEKVSGEMAQGIIGKMLSVKEGATKEEIAGEIDALLADETVKGAISKLYIESPAGAGGSRKNTGRSTMRIKRQEI